MRDRSFDLGGGYMNYTGATILSALGGQVVDVVLPVSESLLESEGVSSTASGCICGA